MVKKIGDYTLRELFEECRANSYSCCECKFFRSSFCNYFVPEEYFCEGDLNRINNDCKASDVQCEESDVQPEKNDSDSNLEARIAKLEKQVEELCEWRCRL